MNPYGSTFLGWSAVVGELLIGAALVLTAARLWRGPTTLDRVMALDMVAVLSAGAIIVHGIATDDPSWVRVAFALALVGFLGTVFFARALDWNEGGSLPDKKGGGGRGDESS